MLIFFIFCFLPFIFFIAIVLACIIVHKQKHPNKKPVKKNELKDAGICLAVFLIILYMLTKI